MNRRVILARHGNTFAAGETPVWAGARTDLPLTLTGQAQAEAIGAALAQAGLRFASVATGPLRRTRATADAIVAAVGYTGPVTVDTRLREIDYGQWEGRSNDEIDAMGHGAARAAWDREAVFPLSSGWSPDKATILSHARSVLADTVPGTHLIVTSNGILRFFAAIAQNAAAFPSRKVATGRLCVMVENEDGWIIQAWNCDSADFTSLRP